MRNNKIEEHLGFNDKWLIIIGTPLFTLVVTLVFFGIDGVTSLKHICLPLGFLLTLIYWLIHREFIIIYHKKYPNYKFTFKRLIFVIFWLCVLYGSASCIIALFSHKLFSLLSFYHDNVLTGSLATAFVMLFVFFLYEGVYYFNKSKLIQMEKNLIEKITAEQKLDTLKNQVNPHFLFNSLNTLVAIIPQEPDLAIKFVQKLSNSYRNILEFRNEKIIPIHQELKALDSYIYLLKIRFQGKIHIYNEINPSIFDHFILPISLQILIENAVKHNITSNSQPLEIMLQSDEALV